MLQKPRLPTFDDPKSLHGAPLLPRVAAPQPCCPVLDRTDLIVKAGVESVFKVEGAEEDQPNFAVTILAMMDFGAIGASSRNRGAAPTFMWRCVNSWAINSRNQPPKLKQGGRGSNPRTTD
jgi:hypothetical protein